MKLFQVHPSQIAQDDLFLSGGVFASVQDEMDRDGGIRSMMLGLRDGHVLNFIFDPYQKLNDEVYDKCTTNEEQKNHSHQILRFDEILDGDDRFDTEFELQDRVRM